MGRRSALRGPVPVLVIATHLCGWSTVALANGGPLRSPMPGSFGGATPTEESTVRLVSEDLRLTLLPDLTTYRAEATYQLDNPKDARSLWFGVPITWFDLPGEAFNQPPKAGAELPSIALRLEGEAVSCHFETDAGNPPRARDGRTWLDLAGGLPGTAEYEHIEPIVLGWCAAELTIPAGRSELTLGYTSDLWSDRPDEISGHGVALPGCEEWEVPANGSANYARRSLVYLLHPAAGWAPPMERLRITLDPGPHPDLVEVISPQGFQRAGDTFQWDLRSPDLEQLGQVRVDTRFDLELRWRELQEDRSTAGSQLPLEVEADPAGADLAPLLDGDPATTWSTAGLGMLTVRWTETNPYGCPATSLTIVQAPPGACAPPGPLVLRPCGGASTIEGSWLWSGIPGHPDLLRTVVPWLDLTHGGEVPGLPGVQCLEISPREAGPFCAAELILTQDGACAAEADPDDPYHWMHPLQRCREVGHAHPSTRDGRAR